MTAEMIVNEERDTAAYVVGPLDKFPRSLSKKAIDERIYALEPCKTRPNSLRQKTIDGETYNILKLYTYQQKTCLKFYTCIKIFE